MFGKDGKIFLAFNPTDAMKEPNMLKRMTEFANVKNGYDFKFIVLYGCSKTMEFLNKALNKKQNIR